MVTDCHSIVVRWRNHLVTDCHSIVARWRNHLVTDCHGIVARWRNHLVTDSHSIVARWRNHFSQLSNVNGVSDVRQTEIHTEVPLLSETSAFEVKLAVENLKTHRSPGIDQIPAEMIKAGGRTIRSKIHKRINSIWNKEEFPGEWNESIIVPVYKKGDKTDC
jgi:hypothetical protein